MVPCGVMVGCKQLLTAFCFHIGCIKSVRVSLYTVEMHMGAPS